MPNYHLIPICAKGHEMAPDGVILKEVTQEETVMQARAKLKGHCTFVHHNPVFYPRAFYISSRHGEELAPCRAEINSSKIVPISWDEHRGWVQDGQPTTIKFSRQ